MRSMVLVIAVYLSGCSFLFVTGPPPHHEELRDFHCTASRAAPVVDTVFAILQGANLIVAAASSDKEWSDLFGGKPAVERGTAVPIYALAAGIELASAIYGYNRTGS